MLQQLIEADGIGALHADGVFQRHGGEVALEVEQVGHEGGGEADFHQPLVPMVLGGGDPGGLGGDVAPDVLQVDLALAQAARHLGDLAVQPPAAVRDANQLGEVGDAHPVAFEILILRPDLGEQPQQDALLLQGEAIAGLDQMIVAGHQSLVLRLGDDDVGHAGELEITRPFYGEWDMSQIDVLFSGLLASGLGFHADGVFVPVRGDFVPVDGENVPFPRGIRPTWRGICPNFRLAMA